MAHKGKRLKNILEGLDRTKTYTFEDAVVFLKKNATAKFDETIEIAMRLNVDTRKADQNIRGMITLPNGTGKSARVAVFAKDDKAAEAQKAGADIVGAEDLVEKITKGEIDFDRCIATPDMMGLVGRVAKILGPKGLMPNPKLGTVTPNVAKAVEEAKAGQLEYRAEKNGIVHAGVAKASFAEANIVENLRAFADKIIKAKPATVKGTYIEKVSISTTMGPSLTIDVASLS